MILGAETLRHKIALFDLSPVHTGDKVEFNTVDFVDTGNKIIGNKVDCCRIRSTLLPIRSTLLSVCTRPKPRGRLCRLSTKSTLLNSTLMTSREITSGFHFWSCGHLCIAMAQPNTKFGAKIYSQTEVIDIFPNSIWRQPPS